MDLQQPRHDGVSCSSHPAQPLDWSRGTVAILGILAVCAVLAVAGYWLSRRTLNESVAQNAPPDSHGNVSSINPAKMFVGWNKPDFVLFITGQTHGYLQPCGCSSPQYGGLARRWGVPCHLSLETPMACGLGICFSCVTRVRTEQGWDYRRVCVDGPIFDAAALAWDGE